MAHSILPSMTYNLVYEALLHKSKLEKLKINIMQKYWQKKNSNALYTLLYAVLDKYRQLFVKTDIEEAKERGFSFVGNVWGDEINRLDCRSIWRDGKNRAWRVNQLG